MGCVPRIGNHWSRGTVPSQGEPEPQTGAELAAGLTTYRLHDFRQRNGNMTSSSVHVARSFSEVVHLAPAQLVISTHSPSLFPS